MHDTEPNMTATKHLRMFAPATPAMHLAMVLPHTWRRDAPFPFNDPSLRYYYLARNAIYALMRLWRLSGQEVLFPSYFHGVELETLLAAGVKPRVYPVRAGMRVYVEDIRAQITPQTRVVYLIHYLGFPGPVEEISALCEERGLLLIEDCALSLLSQLQDKPLGSFGDAAIFCIYKSMPIPHGGALLLRKPEAGLPARAQSPSLSSTLAYTATSIWRNLNFDADSPWQRMLKKARRLAKSKSDTLGVVQVGSEHFDPAHANLAMSPLCEWVLAAQNYPAIIERRRQNYLYLLDRLRKVSPPVFTELPPGVCPLSYPLRTHNKLEVLARLMNRGVEGVNMWSEQPASIPVGEFPEADELRKSIVELPCHQDFTTEAIEFIAEEILALRGIL